MKQALLAVAVLSTITCAQPAHAGVGQFVHRLVTYPLFLVEKAVDEARVLYYETLLHFFWSNP